jgi:hypothetical protein
MVTGNSGSKFAAFEIEVEAPARMKLLDKNQQPYRNGDGREAWIELHSADSEIARKHERMITKKRLGMRRGIRLTPEELEAERIELFVALTVGWDLVVTDLEFSQLNAREFYSLPKTPHIREQIEEFINTRANFSAAS